MVMMISGCGRKVVNNDSNINVSVRVDYKALAPEAGSVDHFQLVIEGSDFGAMILPMYPEGGYIVADTVVPAGRDRHFVVTAQDTANVVLYRGETRADVAVGQVLTLDIDLHPIVPMINITPHYQHLVMNDTIYLDISIFNVPNVTSISLEFSHNFAPVDLIDVVKGDAYGDTVGVYYTYSDVNYTYLIDVFNRNETGTIVDESGYAHLATVALRSYQDWGTDTATVLLQVKPTYIYSYTDPTLTIDGIANDGAEVELYVPDSAVVSTWEKAIGGPDDDIGYSTCRARNGNIVVAGSTGPAGSEDVYLATLDLDGNVLWQQTYGGAASDIGRCVISTTDGGYAICGSSESYFADDFPPDLLLIRTDIDGNLMWQKNYGIGAMEYGMSLKQTGDGGFIVSGQASMPGGSSIYVVKTDAQGDSTWTASYAINQFSGGRSILIAPDNTGYVIAGNTATIDFQEDASLLFINFQGGTIRQMIHGGADADAGYDVSPTFDGGYIVIGSSSSSGAGLNDVYAVKTNSVGSFSWSKTYGFPGNDYGYAIELTRDQGYVIAGGTQAVGSPVGDAYFIKIRSNGSTDWFRVFGGVGDDVGYDVARTTDGGYLIVGYTDSFGAGGKDIYLLKTDADGNVAPSAFSSFTGLIARSED